MSYRPDHIKPLASDSIYLHEDIELPTANMCQIRLLNIGYLILEHRWEETIQNDKVVYSSTIYSEDVEEHLNYNRREALNLIRKAPECIGNTIAKFDGISYNLIDRLQIATGIVRIVWNQEIVRYLSKRVNFVQALQIK